MPKRGYPFAAAAPLQLKTRVGPRELSRGVCAERYSREIFGECMPGPALEGAGRSPRQRPRGPVCAVAGPRASAAAFPTTFLPPAPALVGAAVRSQPRRAAISRARSAVPELWVLLWV